MAAIGNFSSSSSLGAPIAAHEMDHLLLDAVVKGGSAHAAVTAEAAAAPASPVENLFDQTGARSSSAAPVAAPETAPEAAPVDTGDAAPASEGAAAPAVRVADSSSAGDTGTLWASWDYAAAPAAVSTTEATTFSLADAFVSARPDMADPGASASLIDRDDSNTVWPDKTIDPDNLVGAPGAPGTLQTLANYLRVGFWQDFLAPNPASQRYYNIDDNGTGANFGTLYYNVTWSPDDGDGISAARQTMAREAFNLYEAVLGINFVETTSTATHVDFFFGDNVAGRAYAYSELYSGNSGPIDYTVINVAAGWSGSSSNIGGTNGYTFQTFVHEIGHGLGLGHQGLYNAGSGTPTYANSAIWENDSWQLTIMSYWDQVENTSASTAGASYAQLVSPMTVDWIALNNLYAGQDYVGNSFGTDTAFTGNTVWGVGTNIAAATSIAFNGLAGYADTNAFTIVDGGGIDTINFSNYAANQVINLNAAVTSATNAPLSSVGGLTGNMTIAAGTVIENAVSGSGNDTLIGNSANNNLQGGSGNDSIDGGDGNDTVDGGTGADTLWGGFGDDLYIVDNLGDVAAEVAGGVDTVQSSVTHTLTINLENLTLTGSANINGTGNDSRNNVITGNTGNNVLSGLAGNDTLVGNSGADTLYGGDGNDVLEGGLDVDTVFGEGGDDTIIFGDAVFTEPFYDNVDGGAGFDTLDASLVTRNGDTFDFKAGTISGHPGVLTVTGIELFLGGSGNETIVSDGGGHAYYGNGGNDYMIAELGNETMDGGVGGTDTIDLTRWNGPYTLNMNTGVPVQWPSELYTNFENLISGNGNDSITGTSGNNVISTTGGNDTINAGDGNDTVNAGDGDDTIVDTVLMFTSNDDVYDGGAGIDTLVHDMGWVSSVAFDLTAGWSSWSGNRDQLINIENLTVGGNASMRGNALANVLIASDAVLIGDNVIDGEAGNDTINAGGGSDSINAGSGNDSVLAGDGDDTITDTQGMGAADDDVYDGGAGTDTLVHDLNWASSVEFNLTTGFSSFSGNRDQLISIENLIVGGAATVVGNAAANVLTVNGIGANVINGEGGNDTINAGGGNDTINAGAGSDSVLAGDGDDIITDTQTMLASEDDVYNGGAGTDTLVHDLNWVSSVSFNLTTGFSTFGGNRDQLISIENLTVGGAASVIGSAVANVLTVNGSGANVINGEGGNDTINAGGGNDSINAGAGNDSVLAGDGDDTITDTEGMGAGDDDVYDGGAGTDTLVHDLNWVSAVSFNLTTGFSSYVGNRDQLISIENLTVGGAASVIGSAAANVLTVNGVGANLINGEGGNDTINAGGGNDTVDGGDGNDSIDGGDGNDSMTGGAGEDTLLGGEGNDTLAGGADVDTVNAGGGDDLILFGNNLHYDNVDGGLGTDTLDATANTRSGDTFDFEAGLISGFVGVQTVTGIEVFLGGSGNETIVSDGNSRSYYGNGGNDYMIAELGGETMDGGAGGTDTIDLTRWNGAYAVNMVTGASNYGGELYTNFENLISGGGNDTITGTAGANAISTGLGADLVNADGGDDTVDGGGGNDTVSGGAGNDSLLGGDNDDQLNGDEGVDTLWGGAGNDVLWGAGAAVVGDGGDFLYGEAGNDTMGGSYGNDSMDGGADDDTMYGDEGNDTLLGGAGNDYIRGDWGWGGDPTGADVIDGGDGNDSLLGGAGNDTIGGGAGLDTLDGGTGDDSMSGGLGDDSYYVDSVLDLVKEGSGAGLDTVYSTLPAYKLPWQVENLTLIGAGSQSGTGNDQANLILGQGGAGNLLTGGKGADTLIGGAGNDTLKGDFGADTTIGGLGNDEYRVDLSVDVVVELPGEGIDTVTSISAVFELPDNVENLIHAITSGTQTGRGNALENVLTGGIANDNMHGLDGNDTVNGAAGNDTLNGGNGNDTVNGGAGDDSLLGGTGNDSIFGSDGNDTLTGGGGIDTLRGGFGDDIYVIDASDALTEFSNQGYDRVFSSGSFVLPNHFEYLELTSGATGTGNGLDNTLIGNASNNTLYGQGGADSMDGRLGNDNLYAGSDAVEDRFVFSTALNAATNVDRLFEAEFPEDQILLANDIFSMLQNGSGGNTGTLGAGFYFEGTGFVGNGLGDAIGIWYDLSSGGLYYNPTSGTAGDSTLFAYVDGASAALSNIDFALFTPPLSAEAYYTPTVEPGDENILSAAVSSPTDLVPMGG